MIAVLDPVANTSATPPVSAPAASAGRTKEELLRTVSASRLGTWLQCRLKFYFRYVAGITKPTTPARHVGSIVHAVPQQWNLARWRRTPLDAPKVQAVFEQAWGDTEERGEVAWDEDEPEAAVKGGALGLVEIYLRDTPIPQEEKPEAVEVSVELDLRPRGLPVLVGVLDLVRAGGRIVDFKTTGNPEPTTTKRAAPAKQGEVKRDAALENLPANNRPARHHRLRAHHRERVLACPCPAHRRGARWLLALLAVVLDQEVKPAVATRRPNPTTTNRAGYALRVPGPSFIHQKTERKLP